MHLLVVKIVMEISLLVVLPVKPTLVVVFLMVALLIALIANLILHRAQSVVMETLKMVKIVMVPTLLDKPAHLLALLLALWLATMIALSILMGAQRVAMMILKPVKNVIRVNWEVRTAPQFLVALMVAILVATPIANMTLQRALPAQHVVMVYLKPLKNVMVLPLVVKLAVTCWALMVALLLARPIAHLILHSALPPQFVATE
jgi:hypothetical protein